MNVFLSLLFRNLPWLGIALKIQSKLLIPATRWFPMCAPDQFTLNHGLLLLTVLNDLCVTLEFFQFKSLFYGS